MPTILIAGGYGAVGSKIAAHLSNSGQNRIIIAGRNLEQAQSTAKPLAAEARRIDLSAPATWSAALDGVDLVIVCTDQTDTNFIAEVTQRGIAYLDITSNDILFAQVEQLAVSSPVLLSVGLAPGLSNLLAVVAAGQLDSVSAIDIGLLMGVFDEHGSAAIDWATGKMFDPSAPHDDAKVDFGPDFGTRTAYYMDFSEKHALERTLPGVKATTRVTYDVAFLAGTLFWIGRTFAGNKALEKLIARTSHLPNFGAGKCALTVTATGLSNGQPAQRTAQFFGQKEGLVTAVIAALMAEELLAGGVPPGVRHSHQVIKPEPLMAELTRLGHGNFRLS